MANKKTTNETAAETTAASREKRLSLSNIAPSAVNGWTGSVTATIAESAEQVVFSFVTPELGDRDARAVVAGYAARLSIAASGKKTPDDIRVALVAEIKTLNGTPADEATGAAAIPGVYTIRGGASAQSSFSDTIVSLALLSVYPEVTSFNFSQEQYDAILVNTAALSAEQAKWDAADEDGKKALVTAAVVKTKRLVGFYKI